jgi:hypothetical protein
MMNLPAKPSHNDTTDTKGSTQTPTPQPLRECKVGSLRVKWNCWPKSSCSCNRREKLNNLEKVTLQQSSSSANGLWNADYERGSTPQRSENDWKPLETWSSRWYLNSFKTLHLMRLLVNKLHSTDLKDATTTIIRTKCCKCGWRLNSHIQLAGKHVTVGRFFCLLMSIP